MAETWAIAILAFIGGVTLLFIITFIVGETWRRIGNALANHRRWKDHKELSEARSREIDRLRERLLDAEKELALLREGGPYRVGCAVRDEELRIADAIESSPRDEKGQNRA